ncbi:AP-3 complex subunit mu-2 [Marmota marmota marmota]|uniref:AP-3 complex subunit mu-2 n=1 Tax=Marmota marmota marmota TaxID=9994 RepID=UPI0020929AAE|nr:AP-3 complex subunit mu-2 [Marmota marmota marmota]
MARRHGNHPIIDSQSRSLPETRSSGLPSPCRPAVWCVWHWQLLSKEGTSLSPGDERHLVFIATLSLRPTTLLHALRPVPRRCPWRLRRSPEQATVISLGRTERCSVNLYTLFVCSVSGSTVTAEIQGVVDACVKLTGMPDLTLSFMNPRLLDDVSFHPCVRFKRWESERILSFIPPDGNFRLLSYHVSAQNLVAIPVYVKHNISFRDSSSLGRFEITVGPKQTMGKTIEGVIVISQMPKGVLNMSLTPSQGTHTFDPVTKMLSWDVGKINPQKLPSLKGTMSLQAGASKPDENPTINLQFKIQQLAISGLKVNRLDMYGEKYKPFKGIKYMTKAGKFQVRT